MNLIESVLGRLRKVMIARLVSFGFGLVDLSGRFNILMINWLIQIEHSCLDRRLPQVLLGFAARASKVIQVLLHLFPENVASGLRVSCPFKQRRRFLA